LKKPVTAPRRRDDARQQRAELSKIPAVERELDDLLLVHHDTERRVGRLHQRRIRRDADGFLAATDR
jgi:hypothetical protein